jgi:hypothetical protein
VAKDEDGIKVSLSEVPGSKYKAYQGVTLIKAPLAKVQALQEDVVGPAPGFMSASRRNCSSMKVTRAGPTPSSIRRGR